MGIDLGLTGGVNLSMTGVHPYFGGGGMTPGVGGSVKWGPGDPRDGDYIELGGEGVIAGSVTYRLSGSEQFLDWRRRGGLEGGGGGDYPFIGGGHLVYYRQW